MHRGTAAREFRVADHQIDPAIRDVDLNTVAFFDEANIAAFRRLRAGVADTQARSAAGETPISHQRANLAEAFGFEIAGGIQHLLHARPAARAFVADHDDIARDDFVAEDRFDRRILRFKNLRRTSELVNARVYACGFEDAAVLRDIAVQHDQPAVL